MQGLKGGARIGSTHVSALKHSARPKGLRLPSPRKHALHVPIFPSSPASEGDGSLLSVRGSKLRRDLSPEIECKVERLKQMHEVCLSCTHVRTISHTDTWVGLQEARQLELELLENVSVRRPSRHGQQGEQRTQTAEGADRLPRFLGQLRDLRPPPAVDSASITPRHAEQRCLSSASTAHDCNTLVLPANRSAPARMQTCPRPSLGSRNRFTCAGKYRLARELVKKQIYAKAGDPHIAAYANLDTLREEFNKTCPAGKADPGELLDVMKATRISIMPEQASAFFELLPTDGERRIAHKDFLDLFYMPTSPSTGFMDGEKASSGRPRTGQVGLCLLSRPLSVSNGVPSYPNGKGQFAFSDACQKPWASPVSKRPPRGSWPCRLHTAPAVDSGWLTARH